MNHSGLSGFASNQAPPSTLAAQLVDNISTPAARSSHPDETAELKRLFSIIERIKDRPDLLKTDQERIEHNHLLIYVYTRVALDGLQWDNPFAKTAAQVAEASKALSFLQVTITETPDVLKYKAEDKAFLFRDQEPLWLWLLPRILRMLGSEHCQALTPAIERFCGFILDVVNHNTSLWDLGPPIFLFFQTTFAAIIAALRDAHVPEEDEKDYTQGFELTLAPSPRLRQAIGQLNSASQQRCSYTLATLQHAVNHISSLLHIAKSAIVTDDAQSGSQSPSSTPFEHHLVWLLDCLASFNQVLVRCRNAADVPVLTVIQTCLDLVKGCEPNSTVEGVSEILSQQIYSVMVTSCSGAFEMSRQLLAAAEHSSTTLYTLCLALLQLARAATMHKPVARLVKGLLLQPLKTFTSDYHALGHGTDLWVNTGPAFIRRRLLTCSSDYLSFSRH
jgi:serine/threonine-protein kinase ATR